MMLSENSETGDVEHKEVLETYENETEELIHVHVGGEDIVTTPSHPFYVNQFGWTRAAQLRAGDVLVLSNEDGYFPSIKEITINMEDVYASMNVE